MSRKINLKEIERKAYTSYHQDGILDITIAIVILTFSIVMIGEMPWIGGIAGVLAVSIYAGLKKTVTIPRIGYVKFPQQRTQKMIVFALILGLFSTVGGVFVFMQTLSSGIPEWLLVLIDNYMLTVGSAVAALFILGGYVFKTKRTYGYSLLTFVMFAVGHFINFPLYYYLVALGATILTIGLTMMIRFMNKYPKDNGSPDK